MTGLRKDSDGAIDSACSLDYLPTDQLRALQLQRMQATVARAYGNVKMYRQRMDERPVKPGDIQSLQDVQKLPFTVKTDLRDAYPFGLFASPMSQVVRLHASSGTTGKPIVAAYTRQDVEVWSSVMMRTLLACGCSSDDVVQNAYGYGLFTGGLGFHYGAEMLGAAVIPVSGGGTDRQIMIMEDFGVTMICCTPSYFVHLIERAGELKVDLRKLRLRAGAFGAEPWSDAMRTYMESASGIKAYDIYGLTEIIGPGVASECSQQNGLHVFEDHFYAEIIDPETHQVLPDGTEGELVLTTLSKQAMPMIRYRTRDITSIVTHGCPCGRTLRRIGRIGRRSDDMFIIRGINVYPSQIEAVLLAVEGTLPHYQIVLTRVKGLDQMEVQVEAAADLLNNRSGAPDDLRWKISRSIGTALGIRADVRLLESHTIERSTGKAKRVIDNRQV